MFSTLGNHMLDWEGDIAVEASGVETGDGAGGAV